MQRRSFAAILLVALAIAGPGCEVPGPDGPAESFGLDFTGTNPAGRHGAIVFYVDGLNARIFQEMLEAGELPAIRRYFVDRGLYAPRAVANTPSVTLANETSFVTGLFPGHHGVTGINWFDSGGSVTTRTRDNRAGSGGNPPAASPKAACSA